MKKIASARVGDGAMDVHTVSGGGALGLGHERADRTEFMRDFRAEPEWEARAREALPPEIIEQTPLEGFGLVAALPGRSSVFPWGGPRIRIMSPERRRTAMVVPAGIERGLSAGTASPGA